MEKTKLAQITENIKNMFSLRPTNTSSAVKMDHEGLRNFLDLLKNSEEPMQDRRRAYELFSSLLKSHTVAEENVVYKQTEKLTGKELKIKIAEGFVEHHVADDLMGRIDRCTDPLEWSAHANVLAEVVEHHLKEEERDLLPMIEKQITPEMDSEMLVKYLALRGETQEKVTEKNAGSLGLLQ